MNAPSPSRASRASDDQLRALEIDCPTYFLHAGQVFSAATPHLVTTVLGSCVALCLYDPIAGVGGMNHAVLPSAPSHQAPSNRYVDMATETLIRRVCTQGAQPDNLRAKLFGGCLTMTAKGVRPAFDVGARNVAAMRQSLDRHRIPLVGEQVLDTRGMMIKMATATGDIWVRRLGQVPPPSLRRGRLPEFAGPRREPSED